MAFFSPFRRILHILLIIFIILPLSLVGKHRAREEEKERILYGILPNIKSSVGFGNKLFEIMSFIGLADETNRSAVLPLKEAMILSARMSPEFPNLLQQFHIGRHRESFRSVPPFRQELCCMYQNLTHEMLPYADQRNLAVEFRFSQSHKYFRGLGRERILDILTISPSIMEMARSKVVPPSLLRAADRKICVHIRRGDFVEHTRVAHSSDLFTTAGVNFMVRRVKERHGSTSPLVIFITNDAEWTNHLRFNKSESFAKVIAHSTPSGPTSIDWAFSQQFCDDVLLTASGSTYGFWLAYLSRGQNVYYNSVFSKPGGYKRQFDPADFFPDEWYELDYDLGLGTVGVRPPKE